MGAGCEYEILTTLCRTTQRGQKAERSKQYHIPIGHIKEYPPGVGDNLPSGAL